VSSSSRLLVSPEVRAEPFALAPPAPANDAFVQALVDDAAAAAYEQGLRAGEQAAAAALEGALGRVRQAFAAVREEIAALRRERAGADVELATAIAETVVGREPSDGGRALLGRLRSAMAELDDAPLVVRVHPGDERLVAAAVARDGEVSVEGDPALQPGEAVVDGPFGSADVTRRAAWEAVSAVLATGDGGER
jgi:flagellar biosynthesis/type III secretory pathway protein FliH